jgi:hypothetical protein
MLQSTEFWSAIVGAIVGGAITFLSQWIAFREQRKQLAQELLRANQSLATAVLLKLMRIHSNFIQIMEHIEDCLTAGAQHGIVGEPWQMVLPLASVPDQVAYSPEEMSLLLSLGDFDAFHLTVDLDVRHNSLIEALRMMSAQRLALGEQIAAFVSADLISGSRLGAILTSEQLQRVRPKMIEVNSLIERIHELSKENSDSSKGAINKVSQLFREKLALTYRVELKSAAKSKSQ